MWATLRGQGGVRGLGRKSIAAGQPALAPPERTWCLATVRDTVAVTQPAPRAAAGAPAETRRPRLLVVDDEPNIRELLSASLRYAGFDVQTAGTGAEALAAVERVAPHLVVLDVMLPDVDGFAVARRLRERWRDLPVVFLSARDATEDKVAGLTIGGDDYVTKPFSLEEVVARIHAVLRRAGAHDRQRGVLTFADLELDEDSHEVRRGGRPVSLSPTEFRLLHHLMRNPGRVLSKAQILDAVWDYDFGGQAGIVESYISYLRRKVEDGSDGGPRLIHTVRGVGYVLRVPAP